MKMLLVLAVVVSKAAAEVSTAAADCHLSASYKQVSAVVTIPSVTTISEGCCSVVKRRVRSFFENPQMPPQESLGEMSTELQACQSFVTYMQQWSGEHAGETPDDQLGDLPLGFKFKESVSGGGETACSLHASKGALSVSCDIPKSTTISTECCDAVQRTIDLQDAPQGNVTGAPDPEELQADVMSKCQSVMSWSQQQIGKVGPPPDAMDGPVNPVAALDYMNRALPAGLACTEKVGSGLSRSMLDSIFEVLEVGVRRGGVQELRAQPRSSSLVPTIVVAGTAGALGGLVAFIAVSKLSPKPQRVALISDYA